MTRFHGVIGYGITVEKPPGTGIWVPDIVEKSYYGDIVRNTRQLESGDKVNDDIVIQNSISVVADEYADEHFHTIKYVTWQGIRWKVSAVEVQRPRLILTLGVPYNGPTPEGA